MGEKKVRNNSGEGRLGRGVGKRAKNTVGQAREKTSERGNRRKGRGRKYMKLGKGEWGAGDREENTESRVAGAGHF